GRITDSNGPLPGVTVSLSSPALQGSKTAITDSDGRFRFPSLTPGDYALEAALSGFQTASRSGITVGLGKTVTIETTMTAAFQEQITVSGAPPTVDVTSTKTGANISSEMIQSLPVARNFYGLTSIAPGVTQDAVGASIQGSTGAENAYIIDGLNVTGAEAGEETKQLNFDFIQEVEILTGGLPAEYGRLTGGVVNAITKSGGNEFKGTIFGYGAGGSLQSKDSTAAERPQTTTSVLNIDSDKDYGAEAGGYFIKDRLWFFGAYDRQNTTQQRSIIRLLTAPGAPGVGSKIDTDIKRNLYAAKLTLRINDNNSVYGSLIGDPTTRDGALFAIGGPPSTFEGQRKTGGADYIVRYNGVFGQSFLVNGSYGRHHEKDEFGGPGASIPLSIDATVSPNALTGGFGFYQNQTFDRDAYKLDFSKFLGSHEIKVGGDYEDVNAVNNNFNGGAGQRIYKFKASDGTIFYRHRFYIDDQAAGFNRADPSTWKIALPLTSKPETKNTSVYIQDSWRILPNLTINPGFRWETQEVLGRNGFSAFKLNDNYMPRLGVIWDPANNGKSKVFANYGRFYENIPQDINIRAFGGEIQCFCYNFDPTAGNIIPDPAAKKSSLLGGSTEAVDPNLKGQYIDEYLLGAEYELPGNLAVGVKGSYRKLGRVIEDFLTPSGEYFIANPGEGIGSDVVFYDYEPAPAPKASRTYKAAELTARKRFSNNVQFFASYVYSKLEGNYDGLFQNSTGQLDPNINSAYDYADFLINAKGLLTNDRKHQLKFDGSYIFPSGSVLSGLTAGLSTHYYSGTPLTAYGYSYAYNNWEYFLTPRGALGRAPADYEADVHLGYPINFGSGLQLNLIADVFNILNRQAKIDLDQRYNLNSNPACAGIADAVCNGDGGLLHNGNVIEPISQLQNPRATAPNPDFLSAGTVFTGQRSIRLGVRLKF
ncbi:MAG: TonB-dependent receptor, partial [Acidobacteriota bacterium]